MALVYQLNQFMESMKIDYAICGGHAIDLFLGKKTRPHKDLDVAVYWEDRDIIVQHMLHEGWDVYEPCGTAFLHKIKDVASQKRIKTNIWCVKPGNQHYRFTEQEKEMYAVDFDGSEQLELDFIEFLFNTRKNGAFLYAKNHDIQMSLDKVTAKDNDLPFLAPEMVLLYKSTMANNPDYQLDFDNAFPKMNAEQRAWLENALAAIFPYGHEWLGR